MATFKDINSIIVALAAACCFSIVSIVGSCKDVVVFTFHVELNPTTPNTNYLEEYNHNDE